MDSRKAKILISIFKYWCHVLSMANLNVVSYNQKTDNWGKRISYELSGLGYLGVVIGFTEIRNYFRTLKNKCSDFERWRMFAGLPEVPSLTFYCSVKEDKEERRHTLYWLLQY
jgi:hypothetical protein